MTIKINFKPRKTVRERMWKTLNVIVGITTIFNVSMLGALIEPGVAHAGTTGIGDITIAAVSHIGANTYSANGTWVPTGNQCWTNGGGGTYHYFVEIYDSPNSPSSFDGTNPGTLLSTLTPAGCNETYSGDVASADRDLGGNWPVIAAPQNGNTAQSPVIFDLTPGAHTICAVLRHVTGSGNDIAGSDCYGQDDNQGLVSGYKWQDDNGNGVWDNGENALPNWTINLSGAKTDTTTTNVLGYYEFKELGTGTYTLGETQQAGWTQTYPTTPGTHSQAIGVNSIITNVNFGNEVTPPGVCHLTVVKKVNGVAGPISVNPNDTVTYRIEVTNDGTADCTGGGVKITDAVDSRLQYQTQTPESGVDFVSYSGGTLEWNAWTIAPTIKKSVEWTATVAPSCGGFDIPNMAKVYADQYNNMQTAVPSNTVHITGTRICNDTISGSKFEDLNGNGTKDVSEPGLAGWTIQLQASPSWNVIDTTTTDASGNFSFSVPADTYRVREVQQTGWTQTTTDPNSFSLVVGRPVNDQDFGNFHEVSISGQKFNDLDGSGTKDTGEPGLAGWTIQLDKQPFGSVDATTVTDASGNYSFTNLGPGTYQIREVDQTNWTRTTVNPVDITTTSGTNVSSIDFGNHHDNGTIELKKAWSGVGGQTTLNIGTTASGHEVDSQLTGVAGAAPLTTGVNPVITGTYYVSETGGLTNYTTALACTDNSAPITPGVNNSLIVAKDHVVVCTFTNTRDTGTIKVNKVLEEIGGTTNNPAGWTWDLNGSGSYAGGHTETVLTNIALNITEGTAYPGDTYSTTWSCSDATALIASGTGRSFSLPNGVGKNQNVTCTFTNNRDRGTVTVLKHVINDNGGSAGADDFTLHIKQGGVDKVTPFDGSETKNAINTFVLPTGDYYLGEDPVSGYTQTGISCVPETTLTSLVSLGTVNPPTFTLHRGDNIVCTITNNDVAPTLKLVKSLIKDNGGNDNAGQWTLTAAGTQGFSDSGDSTTFHTVKANTAYVLSESGPTGYTPSQWSCDSGLLNGNEITLDVDQDITCTITNNDVAPTITLTKVVVNNNGGLAGVNEFGLTIGGTAVTSGQVLAVNANQAYALNEAGKAGYAFVSVTGDTKCPAVLAGTVTLNEGENIVCTITNNDIAPQLTVIKHVINDNGGTAGADDFTMKVNNNNVLASSFSGAENPGTTINIDQGSYSVFETGMLGYAMTSYGDCSGTIYVGDVKTCTITNDDQIATLIVKKIMVKDDGGTQEVTDFSFKVNDGNSMGFQADAQNDITVNAGTYSVVENTAPGYTTTYDNCTSVVIPNGGTATCTITNDDQAAKLIVKKVLIKDDGGTELVTDFSFKVNGGNSINFEADAQNDLNVDAGTYSVVEDTASGYTTSYDNCSNVVIPNGGSATCTITNNDNPATLIVKKVLVKDNGGTQAATDFSFKVNGGGSTSFETDAQNDLTVDAGTYSIAEDYADGYTTSYDNCTNVVIPNGGSETCTITNDDQAATLIVKKVLHNDNGGTLAATDFSFKVNDGDSTSFEADAQNDLTVNAGTYSVVENAVAGYAITYDNCSDVVIPNGGTATCTITNDAIAPTLKLTKALTKDNGGQETAHQWTLSATGEQGFGDFGDSGIFHTVKANVVYTLSENGPAGYTPSPWFCDGGSLNGNELTLSVDQDITCVITNDDIAPELTIIKHVIDNGYQTNVAADFTMNVTGTNVLPSTSFAGNENGTTVTLAQGSYNVDETGPTGYTKSLSDCSGTINVGGKKTCTITNTRDTGTVMVHKQVDTNGDGIVDITNDADANALGFRWSLDGGAADRDMGTSATITTLDTHTVYENTVPNYHYVGYFIGEGTCADPSVQQLPVSFTVAKSEIENITICNARDTGTIELKKAWSGTAGQTTLNIGATAGGTQVASQLTGAAGAAPLTTDNKMVTTGTYYVSETGGLGNYSSSLTCTDNRHPVTPGANNSLMVAYGHDVVCTFTNTLITIDLTKTVSAATVTPGANLTYTLTWTVGPAPVTGATLTDPLPANTTFVSADLGGTNVAGIVTWNLGAQIAGASGTVHFVVKVNSPLANGTVIANTGTFDTNETTPVTAIANSTVVSAPLLSIVKTNNVAGFTNPDINVTYSVTVSNAANATAAATDVTLTDTLPAGFTFVDGGLATKTFSLGTIQPGSSVTVTYAVHISSTVVTGTYPNAAIAKATNSDEVKGTSNVEVRVPQVLGIMAIPNLTITKTVKPVTTKPGAIITYTVKVSNTGDADATNVVITDVLPSGLTFVENGERTRTWNLGTLEVNHDRVINADVKVSSKAKAGNYVNTATVIADGITPIDATATVTVKVPKVLGLATTGPSTRDLLIFLSGIGLMVAGSLLLRRREDRSAAF